MFSAASEEDKKLMQVAEGASIPATEVKTKSNLVQLHKRGRMLVASYEAIRFQKLDLFSVTLRQIGAYIQKMHVQDAVDVLVNGDGNANAAEKLKIGTSPMSGTKGTLTYAQLVEFWSQFDPYTLNTLLVPGDAMVKMLSLRELQDAAAGLNFQGTGALADDELARIVEKTFDLRPAAIIRRLDLKRPIYQRVAAYGHFGRDDLDLPWERLDMVDALRAAAGRA